MATPHEMAQALITQKTAIESEIQTHITILASNKVDMQTPLVDREGFPRDDIDIYAVRRARVRIIELRNDLKGVMDALGKELERVFDPSLAPKTNGTTTTEEEKVDPLRPFAEVSGVAPGSPAAEAVRIFCSSRSRQLNPGMVGFGEGRFGCQVWRLGSDSVQGWTAAARRLCFRKRKREQHSHYYR